MYRSFAVCILFLFASKMLFSQSLEQHIPLEIADQKRTYEFSFDATDSLRLGFHYFLDADKNILYKKRNHRKSRLTITRQKDGWFTHRETGVVIDKGRSVELTMYLRKDGIALRNVQFSVQGDTMNRVVNPSLLLEANTLKNWNTKGVDLVDHKSGVGIQTSFSDFTKKRITYGRNEAVGNYVDVDDVTLYYEVYGEGEPLLLLHGNGESIASFGHQIYELSKQYQVIALDSRCHGKSSFSKKEMSYELMAADTEAFLDHLQLDKVHVLGWSDGGNTGLIMAMQSPEKVKSLITMGAVIFTGKEAVDNKLLREFKWGYRFAKVIGIFNKELREELHVSRMIFHYPKIAPEDLSAIHIPTLIMAGEKDIVLEKHTVLIKNNIKGAQLSILDGADHYAPVASSELFNTTVLTFLKSIN